MCHRPPISLLVSLYPRKALTHGHEEMVARKFPTLTFIVVETKNNLNFYSSGKAKQSVKTGMVFKAAVCHHTKVCRGSQSWYYDKHECV